MKTRAVAKNLKISARKLRLAAGLVRGMRVVQAEQILAVTPKKAAVMTSEVLKSAVANAENNNNLRKAALRIEEIRVDEGATIKRFRPRSRGMAHPVLHRSAHLTIVLTDEAAPEKKPVRAHKTAKKEPAVAGKEAK